jgi:hypothetical protein
MKLERIYRSQYYNNSLGKNTFHDIDTFLKILRYRHSVVVSTKCIKQISYDVYDKVHDKVYDKLTDYFLNVRDYSLPIIEYFEKKYV